MRISSLVALVCIGAVAWSSPPASMAAGADSAKRETTGLTHSERVPLLARVSKLTARPAGWSQPVGISRFTRQLGAAEMPQMRVAPDGSRAVAWWTAYDKAHHGHPLQVASWTPSKGWSDPVTLSADGGLLVVNPAVTVAAAVVLQGQDDYTEHEMNLRVLDVAGGTWSPPTVLGQFAGLYGAGISDDGSVVMATASTGFEETQAWVSARWQKGLGVTTTPMPAAGYGAFLLSADGSTALSWWFDAKSYDDESGLDLVVALRYVNGTWGAPTPISGPVTRAGLGVEQLDVTASRDLTRVMASWTEGQDSRYDFRDIKTSSYQDGVWTPSPVLGSIDPESDYALESASDGSRMLLTYVNTRLSGRRAKTQAVSRWWSSSGWSAPQPFPAVSGSAAVIGITPALSTDGRHAIAAVDVGRPGGYLNGGHTWTSPTITIRGTVWDGRRWSTPVALQAEVWTENGSQAADIQISDDGRRAILLFGYSQGDYNSAGVIQWAAGHGWGRRAELMTRNYRAGTGAIGMSGDGRVRVALMTPTKGKYAVTASSAEN